MSVALQADLVVASIFAFEKAYALGSYWLSQGVARPGWGALLEAVRSLGISKGSTDRAVGHVKRIQGQTVRAGTWLFGVRSSDMVSALLKRQDAWSLLGLLLPITAFLLPEEAASVLVTITSTTWLERVADADSENAIVPREGRNTQERHEMSFETAHNVIEAVAPYIGHGYDSQSYSNILQKILTSFSQPVSGRLAAGLSRRPTGDQVANMLQQIASPRSPDKNIVVVCGPGFDILCWLAATVLGCEVTFMFDGQGIKLTDNGGRSVTIVFSQTEAPGAFAFRPANLSSGPRDDIDPTGRDRTQREERWIISDYLRMRMQACELGQDAIDDMETYVVDSCFHHWWHAHLYGYIGGSTGFYGANLGNRNTDVHPSDRPPAGFSIKEMISLDLLISRIEAFDSQFAAKLSARAEESDAWKDPAIPFYNMTVQAQYCSCRKHRGQAGSKLIKICVVHVISSVAQFASKVLCVAILIEVLGKQDSYGIPVNCSGIIRDQLNCLPRGMHGNDILHSSVVLEAAALLLGTARTGIQTKQSGVVAVSGSGCGIVPGIVITSSLAPVDNLSFITMPGRLYCRGVAVNVLRTSSWAEIDLGPSSFDQNELHIVSAEDWNKGGGPRCPPSEVLVEATIQTGVGNLVLRVSWATSDGNRKHEYVGIGQALLGMSNALTASCPHGKSTSPGLGDLVVCTGETQVRAPSNTLGSALFTSKNLDVARCFNGYQGVVARMGGDRGHLLRALRYCRSYEPCLYVRRGSACLRCTAEMARTQGASVILEDI